MLYEKHVCLNNSYKKAIRSQCHSVEKREILSHRKNISWNHLFSTFFSKNVAFTKFLSKKCEREFPQFPHCALEPLFSWFRIPYNDRYLEIGAYIYVLDTIEGCYLLRRSSVLASFIKYHSVWEYKNFSAMQILREIKIGKFRDSNRNTCCLGNFA